MRRKSTHYAEDAPHGKETREEFRGEIQVKKGCRVGTEESSSSSRRADVFTPAETHNPMDRWRPSPSGKHRTPDHYDATQYVKGAQAVVVTFGLKRKMCAWSARSWAAHLAANGRSGRIRFLRRWPRKKWGGP